MKKLKVPTERVGENAETLALMKTVYVFDPKTGHLYYKYSHECVKAGQIAGRIDKEGYRRIHFCGRQFGGHRIGWAFVHGAFPAGEIDHINHERADNRIENLRVVTRKENSKNVKMHVTNSSGVVGVAWYPHKDGWRAKIGGPKNRVCLGVFKNLFDAVAARRSAELSMGYHPNHGTP